MLKFAAGLSLGLLLCASAYGQTADECIATYETLKVTFENAAGRVPDVVPADCVQDGHIIALDAEGGDNALPSICLGRSGPGIEYLRGVEDHWHLKAKAILGPNPACIVQLLGFTDDALGAYPDCGTTERRIDLPANEGAKWRNYLREQCPKPGE